MTQAEAEKRVPNLGTGWEYCEKHTAIEKDFDRGNFVGAVEFISHIAPLAEGMDHHPDLLVHDYKFVRVMLSTHDENSVTDKDFLLAQKIETLQ